MKKDKLINVSFRLRRSTLAGLDQVPAIAGVSKSEFVRLHLEKAIKRVLKKAA